MAAASSPSSTWCKSTSPSTACRTCESASRADSSRRRKRPVSFGDEIERRRAARAERAAAARETQATAARSKATGWDRPILNLDEAALLLAAALFDVKHQLESWRTRPFRYRPKGRTDRVDIATELQGELNLWIADWLDDQTPGTGTPLAYINLFSARTFG